MKSTKKGKELYIELIKPMEWLAKHNREIGIEEMSRIRARRIKDIEIMLKRRKNPPKVEIIEE